MRNESNDAGRVLGVMAMVSHGGGAGQIARNLGGTPFGRGRKSVELLGIGSDA
jgi:hypothetical protein